MDASFWNLIGDPTALHFLRRNYALVSYRKAREFAVGRRCSQPIRLSAHASSGLGVKAETRVGRDSVEPTNWIQEISTDRSASRPYLSSQFPIGAIPAEHLLQLCDGIRKDFIKMFSFFDCHFALVRNNVPVFVAR